MHRDPHRDPNRDPNRDRIRAATFRSLLLAFLAATVLGVAGAQRIGDPVRAFLDATVAVEDPDDGNETASGLRVDAEAASGILTGVTLHGAMDDAGVADAARTVARATGFGEGIEGPIADFLDANLRDLAGEGPATVRVETYLLHLDVEGGDPMVASLRLELPRVADDAFAAPAAAKGPDDAVVVIREFSDFQCPFCKMFAEEVLEGGVLAALLDSGEVRFEFHHLPLTTIHANAEPAAEAAQCVADRFGADAFWAYHDLLFERQGAWSGLGDPDAYFARLVRDLEDEHLRGVEGDDPESRAESARERVGACLASGDAREAVATSVRAAADLALTGTPTVFVGGYRMSDFRSADQYARLIRLDAAVRAEEGAAD